MLKKPSKTIKCTTIKNKTIDVAVFKKLSMACAIAAVFSSTGHALELSATVGLDAEHSDNMTKQAVNEQSDLKTTVSASVNAEHSGDKVQVAANYSAARSTYQQDSYEDQTRVTGSGKLVYEQIEKQLIWTLENSRKNVIKNKTLNDVEDNREDRSISSVRADLIMHPSEVDSLSLSPSYTAIKYEDTDGQDSERIGASLSWDHALSKIDGFGAQVTYDDVTFDNDQFDYEYYLYTLSYQAQLSKLNYSIKVGVNESQRESADYSGQYINANASYELSSSAITLNILQELTDTSRGSNNEGLSENSASFNEVDVFERASVELGYQNSNLCGTCDLNVSLMYEEETYEVLPRDNEELRANVNFAYRLTRLMSLSLGVQWQDVSFSSTGLAQSDYQSVSYRTGLNWQLAEKLSAGVYVAYEEREFDLQARDYDELKGGANVRYSFD
ncbi:hypothetical protein [Dasania marina]|uniref:hypothetical protein n=1 Tax=Dasania marina TaxID=471499 RepID=UPI00037402CF|nr:hypothetical protein [Dasania marina]